MISRLFLICFFLQATAIAQTNFSGTWVLQNKEPISGPDYGNSLPKQITLQQRVDSMILESIEIGDNDEDVYLRQAVTMDGKPVSLIGPKSNRKFVKNIQWNTDKKGLAFTIVAHVPNNPSEVDFTRVETWSLSPDGKQLTIVKKSIETQGETWEVKGVFTKKE